MKKIFIGLLLISFNIYAFKIDRVILSTNDNPDYIEFWPIVAKVWQNIGIKPTLALIGDSNVKVDETLGDVIKFEPIPGVKTALHAQAIRLLLPAYFEDEICIISDIDMIPLNKKYFVDSVKNINEDCFVVFRDYYHPECNQVYPMCYNAAKGKTFKELFKISSIYDIQTIIQNWSSLNLGWNTDEILLFKYLEEWKHSKKRCIKLRQPINGRIDRINNLKCHVELLKNNGYIDIHCTRPYSKNKEEINKIVKIFAPEIFEEKKADLVIFSYNRPLQLYALLESIEKYIIGLGEVHVIYRTSNNDFSIAYNKVQKKFNQCQFHKQNVPYKDFKNLVLQYSFATPNDYILYAVDDIVVKEHINISQCIENLEKLECYAFFLRLGKNINFNYMLNCNSPAPHMESIVTDICKFTFNQSTGDWSYPNNLDMTLYRKKDIKQIITNLFMINPNTFEGEWARNADLTKSGLCFDNSKIVNIPLNICNELPDKNRNMRLYSTQELLDIFNQNLKINIDQFYKINNNSAHYEIEPEFICSN